jgi:hypothetical protein
MELKVITADGRRGVLTSSVLEANAFRPVEVQFPEGDRKPYYLRELRIDDSAPPARQRKPKAS